MIGVAVSTRNRPDVLARSLAAWRTLLPDGAVLEVVDDASNPPADGATHRFGSNVGVARVKNKGLELLEQAGVTDYFLVDDDCWPISPDWWRPYVASPLPHLQYLWGGRVKERRDGWVARNRRYGCMLYARQVVLDAVGGMRPEFDAFGWEHVEWTRRIHSAGLTPHRYCDVEGSDRLWFALDQQAASREERHRLSSVGPDHDRIADKYQPLLERYTGSTDYVEFRSRVDAA